ncbi:MAG: hypothetical protein OXG35_25895 [Acidobacteria bacterium]|nr:hypothetical protein [Acidobacteriota bacterium]
MARTDQATRWPSGNRREEYEGREDHDGADEDDVAEENDVGDTRIGNDDRLRDEGPIKSDVPEPIVRQNVYGQREERGSETPCGGCGEPP